MSQYRPTILTALAVLFVILSWFYPLSEFPGTWTLTTPAVLVTISLSVAALVALVLRLRHEISWRQLNVLFSMLVLNLMFAEIADVLRIPLFLYSVGTVMAGAMYGAQVGAATGIATTLVIGFIAPPALAFTSVQAVVGMIAGVIAQLGAFRNGFTAAVSGLAIGVPTALLSAPLHMVVFNGQSNELHALIASHFHAGDTMARAVAQDVLLYAPLDAVVTNILAWLVLMVAAAR